MQRREAVGSHLWPLVCGSFLLLASLLYPSSSAAVQPKPPRKPALSYSKDILPILSDKCFKCHGPDASARQANLRLDTSAGAFAALGDKWAIVPGQPAKSLVVTKINDNDDPMPPHSSGKSLTPDEKAKITRWIAEGAKYGKLWSFEPLPKRISIPPSPSTWPKNEIDHFILPGILKAGLKPSPAADRYRLLRRVTFDLTGLPPTQKEIADFVADKDPHAYEHAVDRLLASPHFGERMAIDWLDAARYSDSYGYQSDLLMPSWPYRDWVIRAFNQNMPYNEFLTEQLAGDLLPNPTTDQVLATAFNRLHRQSNEGGSIAEEFKTEYAVDRVSTFGTAMLGLTLGCARCHDHKFDPISQREFYQLYAYFNSIDEFGLLLSTEIVPTPSLLLPNKVEKLQLAKLRLATELAGKHASEVRKAAAERFNEWQPSRQVSIPGVLADVKLGAAPRNAASVEATADLIGSPEVVPGPASAGPALKFDGDNGLAIRKLPARERWDAFTWAFWVCDTQQNPKTEVLLHRTGGTDVGFCGFDLLLEDGYLSARVVRHWPGNAVAIRTKTRIPKGAWTHIAWSWDGSGQAKGLKLYIGDKLAPTEVLQNSLWKSINAYGDLGAGGGDWSFAQRFRDLGFKGGEIANPCYANRPLSRIEIAQFADGHSLSDALNSPSAHRDDLLAYYIAAVDKPCAEAQAQLQKSQQDLARAEDPVQEISVMRDSPRQIPAYLLFRGRYDAPKNNTTLVHRGVPSALTPLPPAQTNNRLTLAKWLTAPDHPLTARVAVNRIWQQFFGVGLVETSENFGVQGARPLNQNLLDYLARDFIDTGWNVKALVRKIVTSATYRQDSKRTPQVLRKDPENHLFARGPSQRLSAEMLRDGALAAAGLLTDKQGGQPVNPYQPAGIWQENNTMSPAFVQSKGPDLYRRTLYSTWKRTTPMPSMILFDANSREACTVRRPMTNTPLQALVLLNDIQFVEAARVLATDVQKNQDPISAAFVRLAGRHATQRELQILREIEKEQQEVFKKDPPSAKKLLAIGESKAPADSDPIELAALTVTVQAILNSDAYVWKR